MRQGIFLLILTAVLFAVDLYVFQGFKVLVRRWLPSFTTPMYWAYWAVPIVLVGGMLLMFAMGKNMSSSFTLRFVISFIFITTIVKICWMLFLVVDDVVRLGRFLTVSSDIPNEGMMQKINRSEFIVTAGALVSGSLFGGFVYGILRGAHNYQVNERTLTIKNLPQAFDGLRIVQLSDIHSGSFWNRAAVKRGVELVNAQKADLLFFTGDLVNDHSDEFKNYQEVFGALKAPMGIYSTLGNHDYGDYRSWPDAQGLTKDENLERLKTYQAEIGWKMLNNDSAVLEKDGEQIAIVGVENWGAHSGFSKYGDLDKAYKSAGDVPVKLLLSHDPSHWRAQVLDKYKDIVATFSGHTHGMQFGIDSKHYRWSPIKYRYPEWADLYEENNQYLYVNRGFGYLGYPGRVGFNPEITVFELKRA